MREVRGTTDRLRLARRNLLVLVLIAVAGVALFGTLWSRLDRAEDLRLGEASRITAQQVRHRLEAWVDSQVRSLDFVVDADEPDALETLGGFERHAKRLRNSQPGFQAVLWIDPEGVVKIALPLKGSERILAKDLDEEDLDCVRDALDRARQTGELTRTTVYEVSTGEDQSESEKRLTTFLPVHTPDGELMGFVGGVLLAQILIDECLRETSLTAEFRYVLREADGSIAYEHPVGSTSDRWPYASLATVEAVDRDWTLALAPNDAHLSQVATYANEFLFGAGLLATGLLIFIVRSHFRGREHLRRSEALYRSLITDVVDASRVGILILDRWRRVVWMNRALEVYFGFRRNLLVGRDMRRVVQARLAHGMIENPRGFARRVFTPAHAASGSYECHILPGPDRKERWLEHRSQGIREGLFAGGRIDHFYDITPRKRASFERSRLTAAIEQGSESVVITDREGRTQYVNPAFERATGYARTEVIGARSGIPRTGPHDAPFYEELWSTIQGGRTWEGTLKTGRKDGTVFEEVATISPIRAPSGKIVSFVAVKRDVTHEAELQAQLRQAQKMEAVGKLAGGVAHDFNNLLQVILGRSQILLEKTHESSSDGEALKGIVDASKRAARLTKQLLAFGRRQLLERRVLDPNRLVTEHVRMLRRLIGEDVALSVRLGDDVGHVLSDRTQIEQVLMNLCVNARDAMPNGGRILISTSNVVREALDRNGRPSGPAERFAAILVADTGIGIEPENIDRVFEPFFSTKEPGQGSGLGLSTVYGIIKQHDGQVEVESEVETGTTFRILLPVTTQVVPETPEPITGSAEHGTERILVVEDDPRVRALAVEVLARAGYRIRTATDGEDALRLLATNDEHIDLLFSDVVMPKMGGPALARELAKRNGGVRVLLTTGYAADSLGDEIDVEVLSKPYTPSTMLQKIRQVLDA